MQIEKKVEIPLKNYLKKHGIVETITVLGITPSILRTFNKGEKPNIKGFGSTLYRAGILKWW